MHTTELACPADAALVYPWENVNGEHDGTLTPFRQFRGSSWVVPVGPAWVVYGLGYDITVTIVGRQFSDGRVERWVETELGQMTHSCGYGIGAASARLLALAYADADAEIERLADPAVSNRCDHRWAICEGVSHCCALSAGHSGDTHVCLCHAEMTDDGAVR